MAKQSKFKIGQKVTSILSKYSEYEIIEVKKDTLIVSPINAKDLKLEVKKMFFEVLENGNTQKAN